MLNQADTGGDLYEDLKRNGGSIAEARVAARIVHPCMEALAYLHSKVAQLYSGSKEQQRRSCIYIWPIAGFMYPHGAA